MERAWEHLRGTDGWRRGDNTKFPYCKREGKNPLEGCWLWSSTICRTRLPGYVFWNILEVKFLFRGDTWREDSGWCCCMREYGVRKRKEHLGRGHEWQNGQLREKRAGSDRRFMRAKGVRHLGETDNTVTLHGRLCPKHLVAQALTFIK